MSKNYLLIDTEKRKFELNGKDIAEYCTLLELKKDCNAEESEFTLTLRYEIPVSLGDKK